MTGINYDTYYAKHCARYYGWLPASKAHKQLIRKERPRYFTLCAKEAIDVFMLELEGVLLRDQNGKLPNVIICEKEPKDASEILKLVRPPLEEAILIGELEKILTFEDTGETRHLSPYADVRDKKVRDLLNIKALHERAKEFFPFDIINFDPIGNLLKHPLEGNALYQSFKKVFQLQAEAGIESFLLFVTTTVSDIDRDSESGLRGAFESNASSYADIRTALESSLGSVDFHEVDEQKRIAIGFAKSIVISAAKENGWNHKHRGIFLYESPSGRKMLNSVVDFCKSDDSSEESIYVTDIIAIIEQMPEYYSAQDSPGNQEVREHLERVIAYRERSRDEFREAP